MNKYLEKVAMSIHTRRAMFTIPVGAAIGGYMGATGKKLDKNKGLVNKTRKDKIIGGIGGALGGAYLGNIANNAVTIRKLLKANRAPGGVSRTIHHIHSDLGMPRSGFKTKTEARNHYRSLASKHHPDKHVGPAKEKAHANMAKINAAWNEFKNHPHGFEKLANEYLDKIATVMAKTPFNDKDLIKNKPLVEPKPDGTISPRRKPPMTGLKSKVL